MIKIGILMQSSVEESEPLNLRLGTSWAGTHALFDRDEGILVLNSEQEKDAILSILDELRIRRDVVELILLPPTAEVYPAFSDYGLDTRTGNRYLIEELVAVFVLSPLPGQNAEPDQALLQLDEYLVARYDRNGRQLLALDRSLAELAEGIARAYRCSVQWVDENNRSQGTP